MPNQKTLWFADGFTCFYYVLYINNNWVIFRGLGGLKFGFRADGGTDVSYCKQLRCFRNGRFCR